MAKGQGRKKKNVVSWKDFGFTKAWLNKTDEEKRKLLQTKNKEYNFSFNEDDAIEFFNDLIEKKTANQGPGASETDFNLISRNLKKLSIDELEKVEEKIAELKKEKASDEMAAIVAEEKSLAERKAKYAKYVKGK